jgi:AcrR family transcriptional regulator
MRIDQVLKNTDLKKGALYHHFSSKQALGYAVLEELIEKKVSELWIEPLDQFDDPLEGIYTLVEKVGKTFSDEFFSLGCPLNNLAQEMSPLDEGFRERIEEFYQLWHTALSKALKKGQQRDIVSPSINVDDSAMFILTVIEGTTGMTKNYQNKEPFFSCSSELKRYLESLRLNKSKGD